MIHSRAHPAAYEDDTQMVCRDFEKELRNGAGLPQIGKFTSEPPTDCRHRFLRPLLEGLHST